MSERPILFSSPMVRAIMAGAKTQTRRVLKEQPNKFAHVDFDEVRGWYLWWDECTSCGSPDVRQGHADIVCPYGNQGDRLWVRETFTFCCGPIEYKADSSTSCKDSTMTWKPSIFMRRKDSRITLEITEIRCERLQDITNEDIRAEGAWSDAISMSRADMPIDAWRELWESINGKESWEANPMVWVVEFRKVNP